MQKRKKPSLQSANNLSKGTKFCLSEQKNKEFLLFFLLFLPKGLFPAFSSQGIIPFCLLANHFVIF